MNINSKLLQWTLSLSTGLMSAQFAAAAKDVPVVQHAQDLQWNALLQKSQGTLSPELRSAFIGKARTAVLTQLKKQGKAIDSDLLKWVDSDADARDAVYGTVFPADPEILLNLNQLWLEQGADFTRQYKHLSLGAAVARRGIGVDSMSSFGKFGAMANLAEEAKAAGLSTHDYARKRDDEKFAQRIALKRPQTESDKKGYQAVKSYLKENSLSHRQAYEDKEQLAKLEVILKENGSQKKASHCLLHLLTVDGTRKERRTAYPKVSEYFKFLVKINELPASELPLEEGQRWPIFPTTTAPWPLVMPLSRTMPMDEAQFVWDKFLGNADKQAKRRVHNYGPYRKGEKSAVGKYDDLPWNWAAWPAVIKQGGICGTMSTIAMGTATSLGRPVLKAGQPKHSCIVSYSSAGNGQFIASVAQSATAGPDGTGTSWLFRDGAAWNLYGHNTNAVHHYGLALSMNAGLDSYMDSRIALHIYRSLDKLQREIQGRKLLYSALKKNPTNTEIWFTLAHEAPCAKDLLTVIDTAQQLLKNDFSTEITRRQAADEAIEGAEFEANKSRNVGKNVATYRSLLIRMIVKNALADPTDFDSAEQKLILDYLRAMASNDKEVELARDRFETSVDGFEVFMQEVADGINTVLATRNPGKSNKKNKKFQGDLEKRISQVNAVIPDRALREAWLLKLVQRFTADKAAEVNKKGKVKFTTTFAQLTSSLQDSYQQSPKNKAANKQLNALKEQLRSEVAAKHPAPETTDKKARKPSSPKS